MGNTSFDGNIFHPGDEFALQVFRQWGGSTPQDPHGGDIVLVHQRTASQVQCNWWHDEEKRHLENRTLACTGTNSHCLNQSGVRLGFLAKAFQCKGVVHSQPTLYCCMLFRYNSRLNLGRMAVVPPSQGMNPKTVEMP